MCATAAPASAASATASPISTGVSGSPGWSSRVVSGPVGAMLLGAASSLVCYAFVGSLLAAVTASIARCSPSRSIQKS